MKLFRISTTLKGSKFPSYVDWYDAWTEAEAVALYKDDCAKHGMPLDRIELITQEMDPDTLEPVDRN